jgi:Glycine zipper
MKTRWMKTILVAGSIVACAAGWAALAQTTTTAPPGKTLAATMNIYAFPTKGQTPEVQSKDEADCYSWAVTQSGTDPFQLSKQAEAQKQQAANAQQQAAQTGKGAGASGAVKGAAAGALIGEIASDDAGKGAAYGAAAGVIAGRRKGKQAQAQAKDQAAQQSANQQAATQEQMDNFKKAFGVCLEAKGYMVK